MHLQNPDLSFLRAIRLCFKNTGWIKIYPPQWLHAWAEIRRDWFFKIVVIIVIVSQPGFWLRWPHQPAVWTGLVHSPLWACNLSLQWGSQYTLLPVLDPRGIPSHCPPRKTQHSVWTDCDSEPTVRKLWQQSRWDRRLTWAPEAVEEVKGSERAEVYWGHDHRSCKLYTDGVQGWEENMWNRGRRDRKAAQSPGASHCLAGPRG